MENKRNAVWLGWMKFVVALLVLVGSDVFVTQVVKASEVNFNVEAVLPDNQREGSSYFDLDMAPGQKQELAVKVFNHSDEDIVVEPDIAAATTNLNGAVEYGKADEQLDKTAPYDISKLISNDEQEIKVPAQRAVFYKFNVTMPPKEFNGVLAGGITFREKEQNEAKEESNDQGISIKNTFSLVLALLLRENETALNSDLKLTKATADQVNARNVIFAHLQNPTAKYLNQLTVSAKVTKRNQDEVIYKASQEQMQMAPNTTMTFPIRLLGEKIKSGKYTMTIDATSGEDKWHLTKDFEIKADEARKLNKSDVSIEKDNTMLYVLIGVALIIILLMVLIALQVKNKKKK
ncbi:DUF916 and DUF3324 domain-containing protein [Vagococcus xieshaowenii]|nr:DUF916 and DUF3324 domain-containing protein [Vagococcus xieshaowenii]